VLDWLSTTSVLQSFFQEDRSKTAILHPRTFLHALLTNAECVKEVVDLVSMKMEVHSKWTRIGQTGPHNLPLVVKRALMEGKILAARTSSAAKRTMERQQWASADCVLPAEVNGPITAEKLSETKMTGTTSLEFMTTLAMVNQTAEASEVALVCAAKAKKFALFAHHVVENSLMKLAPWEETRIGIHSLSTLASNAEESTDSTTSVMGPSFAANKDK
jgi:hypothetical protein